MKPEYQQTGTNFWPDRKVFVTGATGIMGSWLVKKLIDLGSEVIALVWELDDNSELIASGDIDQISVVNGALEDYTKLVQTIEEHSIDTVIHLGAQALVGTAIDQPLKTFETNIRGTYNLLEACRQANFDVRRVVIASSDKAYGHSPTLPYTEDMPLNGRAPYDVSKSCADLIAQSYHSTYNIPVAVVRCGNIYGGGDLNWSRIVPGTIRSSIRGEQIIVRSDGSNIRDYIYVKDAAKAYLRVAECLTDSDIWGETFNISTENPVSVLDMVHNIQRLMKVTDSEPHILGQAKHEINDQYLSANKARTLLGWKPEFTLEEGLQETIRWYREFLS